MGRKPAGKHPSVPNGQVRSATSAKTPERTREIATFGPWLERRRLAHAPVALLTLLLVLAPITSQSLWALWGGAASLDLPGLEWPWAFPLALVASLLVALAGLLRAFAPLPTRAVLLPGVLAAWAFFALAFSFNPGSGTSPLSDSYPAFWTVPLALLLPLLAGVALHHHQAGQARGWLTALGVAVALFALTPVYRLTQGSIPLVDCMVNLAMGQGAAAAGFGLALFAAAALAWAGGWTRRRALVGWGAAALLAVQPLHLALQAALSGQGVLLALAAGCLSAGLLVTDTVLTHLGTDKPRTLLERVESGWLLRWVLPGLAMLVFFLLKTHAFLPSSTDENIYFYAANLLGQGKLPYRDYFFAHPPLHVLLPGLAFLATGGFNLLVAKLFPAVAAMVAGYFTWRAARRLGGELTALVALILFLSAAELLKASSNLTGVSETTAFLAAGVCLFLEARYLLAGVLLALAAHTGFYMVAVPAACLAWLALGDRRALKRFAIGFLGVYGAIFAACLAVGGSSYLEGAFLYHMAKAEKDTGVIFRRSFYYHAHLYWGALLAGVYLLVARWREGQASAGDGAGQAGERWDQSLARFFLPSDALRGTPSGLGRLLAAALLALVLEFVMFKELYEFYFTLWLPLAAALTAWLAVTLFRELLALGQASPARAWLPALMAGLFVCWVPLDMWANRVFPDEFSQAGKRLEYGAEWSNPPVLPQLGPLVKVLFWRDFRVKGELELGVRHYLWNKKLHFSKATEMADYVRDNSREGDTIAGASLEAPLVALLSGRPLAADIVDTNAKTFSTGMTSPHEFFDRVCRTPVTFLVEAEKTYFNRKRMLQLETVRAYFAPDREFVDPLNKHWGSEVYRLWKLKDRPAQPPHCQSLD
jgi:hypothetical protein